MPIKKILPILVLLSSLFASSCIINDKSLGSQFVSDNFILKVDTINFDLPIKIKSLDSIQGYSQNYMVFGNICDPAFGPVHSNTASLIYPYSDTTYFGIEPELKSVYVNFYIDSVVFFRPDQEGIPQNIKIYELRTNLDSSKVFNTSITPDDYYPEPLNESSPVFFGDDSLKVYLKKDFGKKLLSLTVEDFDSLDLFHEKIKGFYIEVEDPGSQEGGRLNYLSLGSSYLFLNYYLTDPERNYSHYDTTETFSFGYGYAVNSIRTSSSHLATETPGDKLYIESMSGVKPYLNGIELKNMFNEWMDKEGLTKETVLISRAELVFPYEMAPEDYDIVTNQYPSSIFPCFTYSSPDSIKFCDPLPEIYTNTSVGGIIRSLKEYSCDITHYFQKLVLANENNNEVTSTQDLFISPIYSYTDSNNSIHHELDNVFYSKAILNGPDSERKPQLKITYAVLNY